MTEEQKAGKIFLFCKESSQERIMKCLRDAFDVPGSAHDTGLELHNGNLNVTLRIYCESAGDEEQELVRSWSDRARGHFSRVETAVVDVKTNLLYQLEGTESIVSVDCVRGGRVRIPDRGRGGREEKYGADTVSCSFRSSCSHGVQGRKKGILLPGCVRHGEADPGRKRKQ